MISRPALLAGIVALLLLIVAVAIVVEFSDLRLSREQFQTRQIPADMLDGTKSGGVFARLGLLNVVPNGGEGYPAAGPGAPGPGDGLFPRRRRAGMHLYSTRPVSASELPSTAAVPGSAVAAGLPIVSLSVLERDLHDEKTGLYRNVLKTGRAWERRAFVSYFNEGELKFGSGVGVRLHGGRARHAEKKSFRLLFRDAYGADRFPAGTLFSQGVDPLTSFVLDAAKDDATQLVDPIALDVARMVGAIAPETQPVRFFLNGEEMGVYIAMEHISPRYLRAHYGHDDFTMVRFKHHELVSGQAEDYWDLHWWIHGTDFHMPEVAERVDLENFSRWVISELLCLTVDHDQGPVIRDNSPEGDRRWFFINWDMDASFGVSGRWGAEPWKEDGVRVFGLGTMRKTLFTRLHRNDPQWRRYFLRLFVDVLNHEFTPERVEALMARYESVVERFGLGEPGRRVLRIVGRVLEERPRVMREWMRKHFDVEAPHRMVLQSSNTLALRIDGYPLNGGSYTGWYFPDMPVVVRPDGDDAPIRGWRVNDETRKGAELEIASITRDLLVQPWLAGGPD